VTIAIVPVKDLANAKGRLASRLGHDERRRLAIAMLEDVLGALARVAALRGIMVVTRDRELCDIATHLGAEVLDEAKLEESSMNGYTAAVTLAATEIDRRGASAMLVVPGDVPLVEPADIRDLLASLGPPPSVVFVPSHDERGTNAVLLSPPTAFELRFGEPSFVPHVERARARGLDTRALRLSRLALDLDTPADLDAFMKRATSSSQTLRVLQTEVAFALTAKGALP